MSEDASATIGLFEKGQSVLVLTFRQGERAPRPLLGQIISEDRCGVMLEPAVTEGLAGESVYVPFTRVETILVLGRANPEEERRRDFEGNVQKQRVLDELDRIFFDLTEKKGRYRIDIEPEDL